MTLFFAVIEIFKMYPQTGLHHFYYYFSNRSCRTHCVSMPLLGLISFLRYPLANPVFMRLFSLVFLARVNLNSIIHVFQSYVKSILNPDCFDQTTLYKASTLVSHILGNTH